MERTAEIERDAQIRADALADREAFRLLTIRLEDAIRKLPNSN